MPVKAERLPPAHCPEPPENGMKRSPPVARRRNAMRMEGEEVHVTEEEASGGTQPHIVRYVLAASLLLAIVAMSAIWITGAANS